MWDSATPEIVRGVFCKAFETGYNKLFIIICERSGFYCSIWEGVGGLASNCSVERNVCSTKYIWVLSSFFFPPLSQIHQLLSLLPKWYYTIRARGKSRGSSGFLTLLFLSVWFTHLPLCCLSWNKALIKAGAEMRGRKVWFESLSACIHSTPMSFWHIVSCYTALWFCPPGIKLYVYRGRL